MAVMVDGEAPSASNGNSGYRNPNKESIPDDFLPDVAGVISLEESQNKTHSDPLVFAPGNFDGNRRSDDDLLDLCNGITATRLAHTGEPVRLASGRLSTDPFHAKPNGGGIFPKGDGGWIMVTNSMSSIETVEEQDWRSGGVGALEFDVDGDLIGYQRLLYNTMDNRGGGVTPWNSFVTCQGTGGCKQIDPFGRKEARATQLGSLLSMDQVVYYSNHGKVPQFFVSQDDSSGLLTRFRPDDVGQACYASQNWCTLESGTRDYLVLNADTQTYEWTDDMFFAGVSAFTYFRNATTLYVDSDHLYIISKSLNQVLCLDLESDEYSILSRATELRDWLGDGYFYFPRGPTVSGRDGEARFFELLFSFAFPASEQVSVLMSPKRTHLYVTFTKVGLVYEVQRIDEKKFEGPFVDINFDTLLSLKE
jgi:hypothetical protein